MVSYNIEKPDEALRQAIISKINNLNKPLGSLGRLEELALQICLIQQTLAPKLEMPCHILYGADHGIEREGVSVSPREVTWQQMINFSKGGGGVNMFCRQHGFKLFLVDVGVDYDLSCFPLIINRKIAHGTADFLHGPAMTCEQFCKALAVGNEIVDKCYDQGCKIISIGEMGIGNTSPSSIWMSMFGEIPLDQCVGAGAGLDSPGIRKKLDILNNSVENFNRTTCCKHDAETIIRWFGGFEMVAAIGTMLHAAELKMIIMIDGFIMTACALAASKLYPSVIDYMIFAHCGDENGHRRMLKLMNVHPLLDLGLRLGEGTGALCAFPLVDSAVRMMNEMNDFDKANITKYF